MINVVREFLDERYWNRPARYFVHQLDFNTLAASAVAQSETWRQDVEQDFLCTHLAMVITTLAAGDTEQPFPEMTAQIQTSTGVFWNDGFGHAGNIFGRMVGNANSAGPGAFELPYPQFCPGGVAVTVRLNNLEANLRRVWIAFHGVQIQRP